MKFLRITYSIFPILLSSFLFLLAACTSKPAEPQTLTVMTHDSFAVSKDVIKSFEEVNNAKVSFLQSGDAGAVLNQAILTKESPLADVLFGVDNTFLSRALDAGLFDAYDSSVLKDIPAGFQLDPLHRALPVDYGDACINFDKKYFAENKLPVWLRDDIRQRFIQQAVEKKESEVLLSLIDYQSYKKVKGGWKCGAHFFDSPYAIKEKFKKIVSASV